MWIMKKVIYDGPAIGMYRKPSSLLPYLEEECFDHVDVVFCRDARLPGGRPLRRSLVVYHVDVDSHGVTLFYSMSADNSNARVEAFGTKEALSETRRRFRGAEKISKIITDSTNRVKKELKREEGL